VCTNGMVVSDGTFQRISIKHSGFNPDSVIEASFKVLNAVIMVHNHPSGDPSPSEADLRLTRRIVEASRILQLQLIDHVIIGSPAPSKNSYFSFKEGKVIS
jgi:DNA repair protein RadC